MKKRDLRATTTDLVSERVPCLCYLHSVIAACCRIREGLISWLRVLCMRFACLSGLQNVAWTLYDNLKLQSRTFIRTSPIICHLKSCALAIHLSRHTDAHIFLRVVRQPTCRTWLTRPTHNHAVTAVTMHRSWIFITPSFFPFSFFFSFRLDSINACRSIRPNHLVANFFQ